MNILVTGAAGMLAAEVIPELKRNGFKVFGYDVNQRLPEIQTLDITNFEHVLKAVEDIKPGYIFHLAAETDVDRSEKEPDHAFKVNAVGTENIALACQEYGIKLVYISTAGVFFGDKPEPYNEFDAPRPANIYGVSKLQGEMAVQRLLSKYFIVRAGWMVGGWEIDKKFVYKIVQQIKEGKTELRVVADKFGSPTFTKDFAGNLVALVKTGRYGLYHMTNRGSASRYDIAVKIVEYMGLKAKVTVVPINSAQFPLPAPRARSEMMHNYHLELIDLDLMPSWEESLEAYIKLNKDR
ncbi:MAG: dTDP-4-dehydrorhamnose reductase [Candidatus Omnitrophica bacterium]|nr:dTDP-4-dehydrorhamnose reductase [Candidatus Omnitrophota bacterium]